MSEIVLSPDQASILSSADGLVAVRRPDGSFVGWISPTTNFVTPKEGSFTPEQVAAAEREARSSEAWYTTEQVLDHLRTLVRSQP